MAIPQAVNSELVDNTAAPQAEGESGWPSDTDILFLPGMMKVMLTVQRPLIRLVIQDAIEHVRKSLLFEAAFPDTHLAMTFTRNALLAGSTLYNRAVDIHNRLVCDHDYLNKMTRLVRLLMVIISLLIFIQPRAHIPLFRAEVKERCVALVRAEFLSIGSESAIAQLVDKQLTDYSYTFPPLNNVSVGFPQNPS